jgi:WD40 repeat protein
MTRLWLVAGLLVVTPVVPQDPPPAVDAWGDPLSGGACARLGSKRFQQGDQIVDLYYAQDGKRIVTSGWGSIRIWEAATGRLLGKILGGEGQIETMAVTPDGRTICATGCNITEVGVYDADTGQKRFSLKGYGDNPSFTGGGTPSLAISGDGRRLVSAIRDGALRVWDLEKGKEIFKRVTLGGERINYGAGLAVSPDGRLVSAASGTNTFVLSVETGRVVLKIEQAGFGRSAFSSDGKRIACASKGRGGIMIWDIEAARELRFIEGSAGWGRTFAWSPDEKTLAWAEYPAGLRIADVASGEVRHKVEGIVASTFAFSPDSRVLATGFQHIIQLFDPATGRDVSEPRRHATSPGTMPWAYSPDGRMIAAGGLLAPVFFWEPLTGREIFRIESPGKKLAMGFSADGRSLSLFEVEWAQSATLRRFDLVTGRQVAGFPLDPKNTGTTNRFSPDGRFLGLGSHQGLKIVDAYTAQTLHEIATQGYSYGFTFSPDGARLATGVGRKFTVYDTDTWKEVWKEETATAFYDKSVFSADGRELAIDAGNRVRFLDAETGKPLREISTARKDNEYSAIGSLSPDAGMMAIHAWNLRKVLLGDARKEAPWRELALEETPFSSQFSPDGGSFAVHLRDATILVWPLKPVEKPKVEVWSTALLWDQFGAPSIFEARQAANRMAGSGVEAVALIQDKFKARLGARVEPEPKLLKLAAELDAEEIGTRDRALAELRKAGAKAESALLRAMEGKPSATASASIKVLLDEIDSRPTAPGDPSRFLLSIRVLEQVGTPNAHSLLEEIRRKAPTSSERREAAAALERLAGRNKD